MTLGRALVVGTLAIGILDITDAFIFFGLRGVSPVRILQSIAAGLLGRDAFSGGAGTAILGACLHFFIAFCIAAAYLLASRRIAFLRERPLLCGPVYGIAVYLVMNLVVLPLSAAGGSFPSGAVLANGVLIHIFGVGLPAAIVASNLQGSKVPGFLGS
jgi:hypothetical protein